MSVGENSLDGSNRFCEEYLLDLGALQCLLPTHQPRVSDDMEHIIKMIEKIVENECGYVVGGNVFFSVDKSPNYGQLSRQRLDHTQAGKRVSVDPRNRNPADFALWKVQVDSGGGDKENIQETKTNPQSFLQRQVKRIERRVRGWSHQVLICSQVHPRRVESPQKKCLRRMTAN